MFFLQNNRISERLFVLVIDHRTDEGQELVVFFLPMFAFVNRSRWIGFRVGFTGELGFKTLFEVAVEAFEFRRSSGFRVVSMVDAACFAASECPAVLVRLFVFGQGFNGKVARMLDFIAFGLAFSDDFSAFVTERITPSLRTVPCISSTWSL